MANVPVIINLNCLTKSFEDMYGNRLLNPPKFYCNSPTELVINLLWFNVAYPGTIGRDPATFTWCAVLGSMDEPRVMVYAGAPLPTVVYKIFEDGTIKQFEDLTIKELE